MGNADGTVRGFGGTAGFGDSGGIINANELLKNQLRELKKQADVQASPLQGLLDELEKQIDENK